MPGTALQRSLNGLCVRLIESRELTWKLMNCRRCLCRILRASTSDAATLTGQPLLAASLPHAAGHRNPQERNGLRQRSKNAVQQTDCRPFGGTNNLSHRIFQNSACMS